MAYLFLSTFRNTCKLLRLIRRSEGFMTTPRVWNCISTISIGSKFTSKHQVYEYLSQTTWSIKEYFPKYNEKHSLPSETDIKRLLKLSGLMYKNTDVIQRNLATQLFFINRLHDICVSEDISSSDARILPRKSKPITFTELKELISNNKERELLGEISGSWNSTSLSNMSEQGYFLLREGLMKQQE